MKDEIEGLEHATYYMCRGFPFYPHYTRPNVYVGPGRIEKSELELIGLGAARNERPLWPRRLWRK